MNLIVDVGNTFVKLGVFEQKDFKERQVCHKESFTSTLANIIKTYPAIKDCIISSVGMFSSHNISLLENHYTLFKLTHAAKLPFTNAYSTPKTLGVDRIALVSAAACLFPQENVLIIDAGSCITYDFLNSENTYLGGAISPGIKMRYMAMHDYTANLPLLEATLPETYIGNSTTYSIHAGVIKGVINEIEGFVRDYSKDQPNLKIVLTGGDTHFLLDSIKNDIFANSNFLLEGLNYILELNKNLC